MAKNISILLFILFQQPKGKLQIKNFFRILQV